MLQVALNIQVLDIPIPVSGLPFTNSIWSLARLTRIYQTPALCQVLSLGRENIERDTAIVCAGTTGRFLREQCQERRK